MTPSYSKEQSKSDSMQSSHRLPPELNSELSPMSYHYCPTEVFLSIVTNKSIWLSDINTMNDFFEMHWAYDRFIEAANLVINRVGRDFIDKVDKIVHEGGFHLLPFVAAFSSDGDVLSQWRSYAENATGVAIGFDSEQLKELSVRTTQIVYSREKQIDHFVKMILAGFDVYSELEATKKHDFLFEYAANLLMDMSCFKNPAFAEEKEIRLIRAINVANKGNQWSLSDGGGVRERVSRKKLEIKFRSKGGGVVSYIDLPLRGLNSFVIKHVILGPRSPNNGKEISIVLSANGFKDCKITKSSTPYR